MTFLPVRNLRHVPKTRNTVRVHYARENDEEKARRSALYDSLDLTDGCRRQDNDFNGLNRKLVADAIVEGFGRCSPGGDTCAPGTTTATSLQRVMTSKRCRRTDRGELGVPHCRFRRRR